MEMDQFVVILFIEYKVKSHSLNLPQFVFSKGADAEILKSIDRAIEAIHFQATCAGGIYTTQQRSNLQYVNCRQI